MSDYLLQKMAPQMPPPTFCATSTVLLWLMLVEVGAAVPCVATVGPRPATVGLGVFILGVFLCIWLAFWLLGCLVREQVYVCVGVCGFECCALSLALFSTLLRTEKQNLLHVAQ